MNDMDDEFDVLLLIAVLMLFTPMMLYYTIPYFKGEVGGFDVQIDKTAMESNSEIVPTPRTVTTDDMLYMLLVADKYTPPPGKFRMVDGTELLEYEMNEEFFRNREAYLEEVRLTIPEYLPVDIHLQAGAADPEDPDDWSGWSGMQHWQVEVVR